MEKLKKKKSRRHKIIDYLDLQAVWNNPDKSWGFWAEKLGVHPESLAEAMRNAGWKRQNYPKKTPKRAPKDLKIPEKYPWRDKKTLKKLYIDHDLSIEEVSNHLNCVFSTVLKWLKKHEIPRKSLEKERKKAQKRLFWPFLEAPCRICGVPHEREGLSEERVCSACETSNQNLYESELQRFLSKNPSLKSAVKRDFS